MGTAPVPLRCAIEARLRGEHTDHPVEVRIVMQLAGLEELSNRPMMPCFCKALVQAAAGVYVLDVGGG